MSDPRLCAFCMFLFLCIGRDRIWLELNHVTASLDMYVLSVHVDVRVQSLSRRVDCTLTRFSHVFFALPDFCSALDDFVRL